MNLDEVWTRLKATSQLRFSASLSDPSGWNGSGAGQVAVTRPEETTLLFAESGWWTTEVGQRLKFTNLYRWSRGSDAETIGLEHLRFGEDRPVYLFDLEVAASNRLVSVAPHICSDDCYSAEMMIDEAEIRLNWSVTGPSTRVAIQYVYAEVEP